MSDRQQKLEAECHRLRLEAEEAWKRVLAAEAENDRLREALEKIVIRTAGETRWIARAALAKEAGQ